MYKWMAVAALAATFACERDRGTEETTGTEGAVGAEREDTEREGTMREWQREGGREDQVEQQGQQPEQQGQQPEQQGQQPEQQGQQPEQQVGSEQDRQTTERVQQALENADLSNAAENVQVMTSEGRVTLRGNVASVQERMAVERLARSVPGVQEIDNQLEVGAR